MKEVYWKNSLWKYFMIIVTMSLFLNKNCYSQTGNITIEIKIESVNAQDFYKTWNDFRYKFYINGDYKTIVRMDNIHKDDLEFSVKEKEVNDTISTMINYGENVIVKMEAWGEQCGDDDKYDSSCGFLNSNSDKIYCTKEYDLINLPYKNTEPGVWHRILDNNNQNPFWCPEKYAASLFFRWSPPTPPDPIFHEGEICREEEAIRFEVPDHPQKQYVTKWKWQRVKTEEKCTSFLGNETCSEEVIEILDETEENEGIYRFATNEDQDKVRYKGVYSNTVSDWSKIITKTNQFFKAVSPTYLETSVVDKQGNTINTNLICEQQSIKLVATVPDEAMDAHKFYWFKRSDTNTFFLIDSTDINVYTDNNTQIEQYQNLQYGVITKNQNCSKTYSDTVVSTTIFEFQGPATKIDYNITPASCPDRNDGEVTIENVEGGSDSVYYNIAGFKADGTDIDRTTIRSSSKESKDKGFTFSGLSAGKYKVQIINGSGVEKDSLKDDAFDESGYCFNEFDVTIDPAPQLVVNETIKLEDVSCYNGSDGSTQVNFSNAQGNVEVILYRSEKKDFSSPEVVDSNKYTTEVNKDGDFIKIKNLIWGFYRTNITDSAKCISVPGDTIFIEQPDRLLLPKGNIIVSEYGSDIPQVSCYDSTDAFIIIRPTGGNIEEKYIATLKKNGSIYRQNMPFIGDTTFSNLGPGSYTIEIKNGCNTTQVATAGPFEIIEPQPLEINPKQIKEITCYGIPNGSVTVSATGGTGKRQFRIDGKSWQVQVDEQEEFIFNNLDSGWHVIEVQDVNKCTPSAPFSFYLKYPSPLTFTTDTLIMPRCYSGSDGKIIIKPEGGEYDSIHFVTESYKVILSSPEQDTAIIVLRGEKAMFTGLSSADYQVTIEDADPTHACAAPAADVLLPEPTPIEIQVMEAVMPSCLGAENGVIKVKASGGTPGNNPDYYYSIDGNHYVAPNEEGLAIFSGLKAGEYTFYAIDGHHEDYETPAFLNSKSGNKLCTGTLDFTLKEPELMTIYTTVQPVGCYGSSSGAIVVDTVRGGQGDYEYQWEMYDITRKSYVALFPENPLHPESLQAGSYKLTVNDTAGCHATSILEVTQPKTALAIEKVQLYTVSCQGTSDGKVQILTGGGYPPYTYQLNQGSFQSSGFFDDLTEATYRVTVRDYRGCEVSQEIFLPTEILEVNLVEMFPATAGENDGLLRLSVTGGKNKSYYLNGILNNTGTEFSGLTSGEHTISIHYNNGCIWKSSYYIEETTASVPELRVSTKSLQPVSCNDAQDGGVLVQINGGVPPYSYQWNDAAAQTDSEAKNLTKGSYSMIVTDAEGNTKEHMVTIDGPEALEIIQASTVSSTCYQGTDGQASVTVIGGTPPYIYRWNDPKQQITATATQLTAGAYVVTVKDKNGCQLSQEITVEETKAPEDIIEAEEVTLCTGQTIQVDAGVQWASYQWMADHGFTSDAPVVTLSQAGIYSLKVTNEQGCEMWDTLRLITSDNIVDAQFLLPTEIIAGDTVALTEVSWPIPEHAAWSYSENVIKYKSEGEKEYVIFPKSGEYTVSLTVSVGNCTDIIEKKIVVGTVETEKTTESGRLALTETQEFSLYPNPNNGVFTIKACLNQPQNIQVSVYDPLFKHHYYTRQFSDTDHLEEQMDLSSLKSGTYTLLIKTPAEIKILRFIIN